MAELVTLGEQRSDRQPTTVVTQATTWWEAALTLVKLQEIGLTVHIPVKVCYYLSLSAIESGNHSTKCCLKTQFMSLYRNIITCP